MTMIYRLMRQSDCDIYIMREDLLPFSFGGNKLRIMRKVLEDMKRGGYDALLSYGSESSNLNRVAAHLAGAEGLPCTVIFKKGDHRHRPLNELMVRSSGARTVVCGASEVRETVEAELERFRSLGRKPYYVYGSPEGRGNEAVLVSAYAEAFDEITDYEKETGINFSDIFLATGTGITQSGLLAGMLLHGTEERQRVTGISVARDKARAESVIREDLDIYLKKLRDDRLKDDRYKDSRLRGEGQRDDKLKDEASGDWILRDLRSPDEAGIGAPGIRPEIRVIDDYVSGGYGESCPEIRELCRRMLSEKGLPLDETYTGKAFYGMTEEIRKERILGPVLFIHTGGLPCVFDAAYGDMLS